MSQASGITIAIATSGRRASLLETLTQLKDIVLPTQNIELLVAFNGSPRADTVTRLEMQLPFEWDVLIFENAGKSIALNACIDRARYSHMVLIDDDISPNREWLNAYWEAIGNGGLEEMYCGPIRPRFPQGSPEWLPEQSNSNFLFGAFSPSSEDAVLPSGTYPYGGNMALATSLARRTRFDPALGPGSARIAFSEDTDFGARISAAGHQIRFLIKASVEHRIRQDQLCYEWMFTRSFLSGRSYAGRTARVTEYDWADQAPQPPARVRMSRGMIVNFYLGQAHEFSHMGLLSEMQMALDLFRRLPPWRTDSCLLCEAGRATLHTVAALAVPPCAAAPNLENQ